MISGGGNLSLSPPQHSHVAIKRGENVETHDDRIVVVGKNRWDIDEIFRCATTRQAFRLAIFNETCYLYIHNWAGKSNFLVGKSGDRMRVLLLLRVFFNYVNDLSIQFGARRF